MRVNRRAFCAMLLLPLLSAAPAKPPVTQPATQPAAGATRLRVLTYNIHHGEGTDGKFDIPRIAKLIKSLEPDLVAVQEVDVKTRRSSGVDQAAELAKLTGLHPFFARIIDYQGGPYGLMILSRQTRAKTESDPLPYDPGQEPGALAEARVHIGGAAGGEELV